MLPDAAVEPQVVASASVDDEGTVPEAGSNEETAAADDQIDVGPVELVAATPPAGGQSNPLVAATLGALAVVMVLAAAMAGIVIGRRADR